jgi:hypothetical protein
MSDNGFSIRCPHCLEWTESILDPEEIAIDSEAELIQILNKIENNPEYYHPKLIKCTQPHWICPAPFVAFVFRSENDALHVTDISNAWEVTRGFRLYKTDHIQRWDKYVGLLVCVQPVLRQRHVLLTNLIDKEIISRLLVGVTQEVGSPVTLYVANVYESMEECQTYWIPIEQYNNKPQYVPSNYNPLCKLCRHEKVHEIIKEFDYKPNDCPLGLGRILTCAGKTPACRNGNLNYCPHYLEIRKKYGMCYYSDLSLIKKVELDWCLPEYPGWTTHECWAGLTEIAVPIIVHDLLVGVLITGQFILNTERVLPLDKLIQKLPSLKKYKQKLIHLFNVIWGNTPKTQDQKIIAKFIVTEEKIRATADMLFWNARRISLNASNIYQNYRNRLESLFKNEIIAKISTYNSNITNDKLVEVLNRMRTFWGYKAVYLLSYIDNKIIVISFDNESCNKVFKLNDKILGYLQINKATLRPFSVVFNLEQPEIKNNELLEKLTKILKSTYDDEELATPRGNNCYLIGAPSDRNFLMFLFVVRDTAVISTLSSVSPGKISEICRESMFDTCVKVINEINIVSLLKRLA